MRNPHTRLYVFSLLAWATGRLVNYWPVVLITAFFLSPVGPHLLWTYHYRDAFGHRTYTSCTYIGSRGLMTPRYMSGCPVVVWLDTRDGGW